MDLETAYQKCPKPELNVKQYSSCVKFIACDGRRVGRLPHGGHGKSHDPGCRIEHGYGRIVCYEYICTVNMYQPRRPQHGSGSGEGSDEGSGEEGSGNVLERL